MPDTNRYARKTYSPDGVNREFIIDIEYLKTSELSFELLGVEQAYGTHWTLLNPTTARFVTIPPAGTNTLVLTRSTDVSKPAATFTSPGTLTFSNLNRIIKQLLFGVQESHDRSIKAETILGQAQDAANAASASAANAATSEGDAEAAAAQAESLVASLSVATVSDLRALTATPLVITVKGSAGSGGLFEYVDGDTTTPDDGALWIVRNDGKRYKRNFNPGEYYAAWWIVVGDGVTPCDERLRDACAGAKGGVLYLPKGRILLSGGATVHLVNIRLVGMGSLNWSGAGPEGPEYTDLQHWGDFGTTFCITSTTQQPFTWDNSVTIEHCNFWWPNQTGQSETPTVYPPLITDRGVNYDNNGGVSNNVIINCSVLNAYQFMKQSAAAWTWGNIRVLYCDIYSIECDFELRNVAEQFFIIGCVFNAAVFHEGSVAAATWTAGISNGSGGAGTILNVTSMQRGKLGPGSMVAAGGIVGTKITAFGTGSGLTGTYTVGTSQFVAPGTSMTFSLPLLEWSRANGRFLRVMGNGVHANASSQMVGGLAVTNSIIYGRRRAVEVVDGSLDFATFDPSCHFDGCPQVLYCGTKGTVTHTRFLGSYYSFHEPGDATNYACFELDDPAANGPTAGANIEVSGDLRGGNGAFFKASGGNINRIELTKLSVGNWGGSSTAASYYGTHIDAANADVRISASNYFTGATGDKGLGIYVPSSRSLLVDGVMIRGAKNPINFTGNTGPILISGCVTLATQSTFSVLGAVGTTVAFGINNFDKPNRALDGNYRFGSPRPVYIGGVSHSPFIGLNVYDDNGTYCFGAGSGGDYGAFLRLDGVGGVLSLRTTTTGGAEGAAATSQQTAYLDAPTNTLFTANLRAQGNNAKFDNIATTASGANAVLDGAANNSLLRSTSSLHYKRDVEPMDYQRAEALVRGLEAIWYRSRSPIDNQEWSWYGVAAEQAAEIDPRLVTYGLRDEDYEEVVLVPEREEQIELSDGNIVTTTYPAKTDRRPKADAMLKPDGFAYDRMSVPLLLVVKKLLERVEALEAART